jgi:hypothetical protein
MLTIEDKVRRIMQDFRKFDSQYQYQIMEITETHLYVGTWDSSELKPGEYFELAYTYTDAGTTFDPRESWAKVEKSFTKVAESVKEITKESQFIPDSLLESAGRNEDGVQRIRAIGLTADTKNLNRRIYTESAVKRAVEAWQAKFRDSSGQGRLLGEVEHAEDKPTGRPSTNEIAIRWDAISYDPVKKQVLLEGAILPTTSGSNLMVLLEHNVKVGISQRAYGKALVDSEGNTVITDFVISGYDAVIEPADKNGTITALVDSLREQDMKLEEIKALIAANKHLFGELEVTVETADAVEKSIRSLLKLNESDDITKKVDELNGLEVAKLAVRVQTELIAGDAELVEATKDQTFATFEDAKAFIDSFKSQRDAKLAEDKALADAELNKLGYKDGKQMKIETVTPVVEKELGIPEYANGYVAVREAFNRRGKSAVNDAGVKKLPPVAQQWIDSFTKNHQAELAAESAVIAKFNEANTTTDLSLPYTAVLSLIGEFFPRSVAASAFSVQVVPSLSSQFTYKTYSRETGYEVAQAAIAFNNGAWETAFVPAAIGGKKALPKLNGKQLANLKIGSVLIAGFVEGTDFSVDYRNAAIYTISAGFAAAVAATTIAFSYYNIQPGEMVGMERVKMQTSMKPVTLQRSALGVELSHEAIAFASAQLGYDILADAIGNAVGDMARLFDRNMYYLALAAALGVASNKVTYSLANAQDSVTNGFTVRTGEARVKLEKRFYPLDELKLLVDADQAEAMSNANFLSALNGRADNMLDAKGYIGMWKGMPVLRSTEFGAVSGSKRFALVTHPEQAQALFWGDAKIEGPFPRFDSNGKLLGAKNYSIELWDALDTPIMDKASVVEITA